MDEARCKAALKAHVRALHPRWARDWEPGGEDPQWGTPRYQVLTVIEPCERCGEPIVLIQREDYHRPVWYQLGELRRLEGRLTRLRLEGHGARRCAERRAAGEDSA
jgi:hypothetical protein